MEKKIEIIITEHEDPTGFKIQRTFENLSNWEIIGILKHELLLAEVRSLEDYNQTKQDVSKEQTT